MRFMRHIISRSKVKIAPSMVSMSLSVDVDMKGRGEIKNALTSKAG